MRHLQTLGLRVGKIPRVGFMVASNWGYSYQLFDELDRALSEKNFSSRVRTLSGGYSHNGACRSPMG